MHSILLKLR